jgi:hypothetical protein
MNYTGNDAVINTSKHLNVRIMEIPGSNAMQKIL